MPSSLNWRMVSAVRTVSTPNVDTVRTALTIRQVKDEGMVAIEVTQEA